MPTGKAPPRCYMIVLFMFNTGSLISEFFLLSLEIIKNQKEIQIKGVGTQALTKVI